MIDALDYQKLVLKKDCAVVDDARMLGFAVEQFNNLAYTKGCNAVRDSRVMPLWIEVDLDHYGRRKVLLHNPERTAAVSIGQAIRREVHKAGYGFHRPNLEVHVGE